ncbi:MAG: acyl-CoA dehydrogenase family protein [Deltaproteobacteria bacterium]|nr:acyl-CoA dehydrogenase family protein [Deltaproteobacteria bacterium]
MEIGFTDTQRMIRRTIRDYLTREVEPLVPEMEAERLPPYDPLRKMMAALGLGRGGDLAALIAESPPEENLKTFVPRVLAVEMSRVCGGLALSYGASVGLAAGNIRARGTEEQKKRWAVPLLKLEKIGAWALTEPQAGSAAIRDMKSRAVRDGDHYVLNGTKTFITNAPYADVFVVYAKLEQHGSTSVQAFIVERGDPGLDTGKPFKKMGFKSSPTGEVFLSDCRISADRLIGGEPSAKGAVRERLSRERIGLQAISYGILERAFEIALRYARERQQGGRPIGGYQLVQRRLARMYMALANARAYVFADVLAGRDLGGTVADASVGKLYVAEMASYVATEAIHILAGNGYMEEYVVERLVRDAKLIELGGGTTEIQELTAGRWLVEHYEI